MVGIFPLPRFAPTLLGIILLNWADDEKRMQRELIKLGAHDTETIIGKDGVELDPPSLTGAVVPPVPPELHGHRPRLRSRMNLARRQTEEEPDHGTIPSAATPKRNREEGHTPMETMGDIK